MSENKPYIQRLAANVKGKMDTELSPCTLLVGKTGAGKTAIVDAVSLALRGEARTSGLGKQPGELMRLAPPDTDELYADVTLSTGEVCQWTTKGSTKTTQKRIAGGDGSLEYPAGVFVSDVASGLMLGDAKKLQQVMLAATNAEISLQKVLEATPESLHGMLRTAFTKGAELKDWPQPPEAKEGETKKRVAEMAPHVATPTDVAKALSYIDSQRRSLSKRLSVLGDTVAEEGEEAIPLSDDELEELKKLEELDTKLRLESSDPEQLRRLVYQTEERIQDIENQMVELSPMGSVGIEKLAETHETLKMISRTQKFLVDKLDAAVEKHGSEAVQVFTCPVCATPEVETQVRKARFEFVSEKFQEAAEKFENQTQRSQRWHELKAEKDKLKSEAERLSQKAAKAQPRASSEKEDQIRTRLSELRDRDQKARQESANKAVVPELEQDGENWKAIKEVLTKQLSLLVESSAAVAEKRLNQFLPKNIRAKIVVKGAKKDAVRIEVAISGRPYRDFRTLSGGQRATLIAAVSAAMIPPEAPPVRIVLLDEVAMDSAALRSLMGAVTKSVAKGDGFSQAIFCTTSWSGKAPKGWSLIQITRGTGQEVAELVQA